MQRDFKTVFSGETAVKKYYYLIAGVLMIISSFNVFAKEIPAKILYQIQAKFSDPKIIDEKKFNALNVMHLAVRGADHSDAFVIITPQDKVINIDDYAILSAINIKSASNFKALAGKNPAIDSLWPGNHQYPESVTLAGGIQQLQFTYSVLNGCHACAIGAIAKVGFNFDAEGNFLGTQLLALSPPPVIAA
jgi:hypothetical protein